MPRALKVLDASVLVGEPPNLWLMKDTNGELKADTKDLVSDTYGRAAANIEHNANSLFWGIDNTIYTSEHDWHLRFKNGEFETIPTLARGQWGASMDDAGRIFATSTMRRCSWTSSPRDTTREIPTWCAHADSTIR